MANDFLFRVAVTFSVRYSGTGGPGFVFANSSEKAKKDSY